MNQNNVIISLINISKSYGSFLALKSTNFEVFKGELFGLLGPNGAGKTTMIRILTDIIRPTSGQVTIGGYELLTEPAKAKSLIGFVPDRPYLYEKLTPIEYLDFMGGLYRVAHDKVLERGEKMLRMFDLWERRNELIESFSHGMKQKVAMSAAVIHEPDILIVDEPTVGLDPKSVRLVKNFFLDFASSGKTVFLTTHTLSVAQDLCHRIAILQQGEVIALGTMQELQQKADTANNNLEEVFLKLTQE